MIEITLPDGKKVRYPEGVTPLDVARDISEGLARNVISARYNNRKVETVTPLQEDGSLVLYTWNDEEGKKAFWHSSSHILAQALEELYPGIKLTIGPAIDNGFYYDVDFGEHAISEKDFRAIEKRALEIARGKHDFKMREVSKAEKILFPLVLVLMVALLLPSAAPLIGMFCFGNLLKECGVQRVTASYDLNRDQLMDLVGSVPSTWLEVVIHQHVPMFHMEHCVFCAVISPGTNKTNCGRPCDRHVVQLRDRVGAVHTLQADVACRNTLYNATAQSGAECVSELMQRGVGFFRLELLEESSKQVRESVTSYQRLLASELSGKEVWQQLNATNRLGVTRGTLEAKRNPLEIL